jgi:hypothetical protein
MKRIMAMLIFQSRRDAGRAADALDEAGYESNIREDIVDVYSGATFMEAWRHVAGDKCAACAAVLDDLNVIVRPFEGTADEAGVFAEGEHHDFGDPPRIGSN